MINSQSSGPNYELFGWPTCEARMRNDAVSPLPQRPAPVCPMPNVHYPMMTHYGTFVKQRQPRPSSPLSLFPFFSLRLSSPSCLPRLLIPVPSSPRTVRRMRIVQGHPSPLDPPLNDLPSGKNSWAPIGECGYLSTTKKMGIIRTKKGRIVP
jgi:hypothetical protein